MDDGLLRRRRCLPAAAAVALILLLNVSTAPGAAEGGGKGGSHLGRGRRRAMLGPGSSPPTCRARCGGCSPCRPVHVAVQPGRSVLLEYYPEAWRCRCGNRLFTP